MEDKDTADLIAEEGKRLFEQCRGFVLEWVVGIHGSATDFVRELEKKFGWKARHYVIPVLKSLRDDKTTHSFDRKYLLHTLTDEEVTAALEAGSKPRNDDASSLDQLFRRSRMYRASEKFSEAVAFAARFRDYSPFNNMLVYLQNPSTTYFATESHWRKAFGRMIKEDGKGMLILAPKTPVLLVYDIEETEGPELPEKMRNFATTEGAFDAKILDRTLENCERDLILVQRKDMGQLSAGFATTRLRDNRYKMRIAVREQLDTGSAYSVLCHELAHIYLGHLGSDEDNWWPCRMSLSHRTVEVEAEAASYIVCSRLGLMTRSAEYLSTYIRNDNDLQKVSIDLVTRVASRIEEMGKRLQPARKPKGNKSKQATPSL